MKLSVATVLNATGARLLERAADGQLTPAQGSAALLRRSFGQVVTDSRGVLPGSLFVALRGERVDGHDFISDSFASGAGGVVVSRTEPTAPIEASRERDPLDRPLFFVVSDPLKALQNLARYWRQAHDCEVIGITGSLGKTTTKELVAALLAAKMPVLKSEGNFNTEIGLPLTLLNLESMHRAAVVEMGMYGAGEVALLARIAGPQTGIVTNVAPIHLERLGSIDRIARAKSELVAELPEAGLALLNADDPWTRAMAQSTAISRVQLVGFRDDSDYRARDVISRGLDGTSFTVEAEGAKTAIHIKTPGLHLVHAVLFAIAVGRAMEMKWQEIQEILADVRFDSRQRILESDGVLIIDDTYNASPLSVAAALQLLASSPGNKIAVLGDMLELGENEEEAHRQVGEQAGEVVDWLVLRGLRTKWIAEGAESKGLDTKKIVLTDGNPEAAQTVLSIIAQGADAFDPKSHRWSVLVKGSRGMTMEEVVEEIRGNSCTP